MITINELRKALNRIAPEESAESWDNCGFQINTGRENYSRILVCLEITKAVIEEAKEKKAEIKRIISTDRVKKAVKTAKPNSKYMKIMLLPIKWNNAGLTYMEGRVISKVKSGNTKTFAKLKAGR